MLGFIFKLSNFQNVLEIRNFNKSFKLPYFQISKLWNIQNVLEIWHFGQSFEVLNFHIFKYANFQISEMCCKFESLTWDV